MQTRKTHTHTRLDYLLNVANAPKQLVSDSTVLLLHNLDAAQKHYAPHRASF